MRRSVLLLPLAVLYLALSGFDCAGSSSQMTTARVALQRKDYAAAATALEKEVQLRPNNGAAWFTLAEIYDEQQRPVDAMRAIEKARVATEPKLTATQLEDSYIRQFNIWRTTYNRALDLYRKKEFTRAIAVLDTAAMVGPEFHDNVFFRGTIQEEMDDKTGAMRTYEQYIEKIAPTVEMGTKLGLALNVPATAVEARLGKPDRADVNDTTGGYYYYSKPNLYVYFAPSREGAPTVEGWRTYDAAVPEKLRPAMPAVLRADPYAILALNARTTENHDAALRYLQSLSRIDPSREGVAAMITDIYIKTNRVDQAITSLRSEIAANPKDPRPLLDLGNLYFGAERFRDAATSFESITTMGLSNDDQHLRNALFNLGAVYKNWGAKLQDSIKRVSNGKPSKAQNDVYMAPLRESAKYFERYRSVSPNEFQVLVELGNLYDVLGDTGNRDKMIGALEAMSSANSSNREYWRAMSRLYALFGDAKKAEAADKKADALR